MKEVFEFRIDQEFAPLLFKPHEGQDLGTTVKVVRLTRNDPRFGQIPIVSKEVREKYGKPFFFSWRVKRSYSQREMESASLFRLIINKVLEPCGEESGTLYDSASACPVCGANERQIGLLKLNRVALQKNDIARTIGGEVVVSERFFAASRSRGLKGARFEQIEARTGGTTYYQLLSSTELQLTNHTIAGVDPFDFSEVAEAREITVSGRYKFRVGKEVYKCSLGHTVGLNLLSEAHVADSPLIKRDDYFHSDQQVGVRRGVLRPEPLYFCSSAFREMVIDERLRGFDYEVAHVETL